MAYHASAPWLFGLHRTHASPQNPFRKGLNVPHDVRTRAPDIIIRLDNKQSCVVTGDARKLGNRVTHILSFSPKGSRHLQTPNQKRMTLWYFFDILRNWPHECETAHP